MNRIVKITLAVLAVAVVGVVAVFFVSAWAFDWMWGQIRDLQETVPVYQGESAGWTASYKPDGNHQFVLELNYEGDEQISEVTASLDSSCCGAVIRERIEGQNNRFVFHTTHTYHSETADEELVLKLAWNGKTETIRLEGAKESR